MHSQTCGSLSHCRVPAGLGVWFLGEQVPGVRRHLALPGQPREELLSIPEPPAQPPLAPARSQTLRWLSRSARACRAGCPGAGTAALPAICCHLIVVLLK